MNDPFDVYIADLFGMDLEEFFAEVWFITSGGIRESDLPTRRERLQWEQLRRLTHERRHPRAPRLAAVRNTRTN